MSGGSWDYCYMQLEEPIEKLLGSNKPERQLLGKHLKVIQKALRNIEWTDSGDTAPGSEIEAIKEVFGEPFSQTMLKSLTKEAYELIKELEKYSK